MPDISIRVLSLSLGIFSMFSVAVAQEKPTQLSLEAQQQLTQLFISAAPAERAVIQIPEPVAKVSAAMNALPAGDDTTPESANQALQPGLQKFSELSLSASATEVSDTTETQSLEPPAMSLVASEAGTSFLSSMSTLQLAGGSLFIAGIFVLAIVARMSKTGTGLANTKTTNDAFIHEASDSLDDQETSTVALQAFDTLAHEIERNCKQLRA